MAQTKTGKKEIKIEMRKKGDPIKLFLIRFLTFLKLACLLHEVKIQ